MCKDMGEKEVLIFSLSFNYSVFSLIFNSGTQDDNGGLIWGEANDLPFVEKYIAQSTGNAASE